MIRINSLKVPGGSSLCHVRAKAARILKIKEEAIKDMVILKRSRDARDRGNILDVYSVALGMDDEHIVLSKCHDRNVSVYRVRSYCPPAHGSKAAVHRPVIAGFGPSGMFAAYLLSMEGYRPIVFERGSSMDKRTEDAVQKFNELNESIKASEKRLAEILALKKHILNYRKTKDVYVAYRKAGYSRKFFEEHRQEIALHKAAKAAFDQLGTEKLPTIRELNEEYDAVLREKKAVYAEYRAAKKEMQEYSRTRKNVQLFYRSEIEKDYREQVL